ncbi:peptidylprolyl isomerase [Geomesophilobacter sediminis]|uniref:Peptidyl-prolyl cis-trans isomerase n=1 Tax=Geomesophilobacter sediminis TaxID=2798584 RepID=A0A8J7JAC9_9BACT|nr:peptidylprolyl isomerase [Geomesophilobacter sediminis]MBJ6723263.1 peptidylprolyl isomerase [Geomesophilobacter sediminis]
MKQRLAAGIVLILLVFAAAAWADPPAPSADPLPGTVVAPAPKAAAPPIPQLSPPLPQNAAQGRIIDAAPPAAQPKPPQVLLKTSAGDIVIELDPVRAPISVQNFLDYVRSGFYNGTIFHRVVRDYLIQGGLYTPYLKRKETDPPITNEAKNGLRNRRGTVGVARPVEPDSGTSEFYINVVDNRFLDHKDDSVQGYGYAIFGRVVQGMNVVDRMSRVRTGKADGMKNVPDVPLIIYSARVIQEP